MTGNTSVAVGISVESPSPEPQEIHLSSHAQANHGQASHGQANHGQANHGQANHGQANHGQANHGHGNKPGILHFHHFGLSVKNIFQSNRSNKVDPQVVVMDGESRMLQKISALKDKQLHLGSALQHLQERRRFNFDIQLLIYMFHVGFFLATILSFIPVHFSFEQVDMIGTYFSNNQNSAYMNYDMVTTKDDIYTFLRTTVLTGLLIDPNNHTLPEDINPLANSQRLIGLPLLRQVRTRPSPCHYDPKETECFEFFEKENEDKRPIKGYYNWTDGYPFLYPSSAFYRDLHLGVQQNYGTGGYGLLLPIDKSGFSTVQKLQDDKWIGRPTRAVAINFSFFNADLGFVTSIEYLYELSPTGRIEPTRRINSYPLISWPLNKRDNNSAEIGVYIVFCIVTAIWMIDEFRHILHEPGDYFSTRWNVLEFINMMLFGALIIAMGVYMRESSKAIDNLLKVPNVSNLKKYYDFQTPGFMYYSLQQLVGVCCLTIFMKIFKFFRAVKKLNLLWRTLELASGTLVAYAAIFLIVFMAFSFQGYFLLGFQMRTFHAFPISILTAFRMMSGDFNFSDIQTTSPVLGPSFFIAYMVFVFLILVNMFIAILTQYYDAASTEAREVEQLGNKTGVEYELGQRIHQGRPRLVLSKDDIFVALEQNTVVFVVLSNHELPSEITIPGNAKVFYIRSAFFSDGILETIMNEPYLECSIDDDHQTWYFGLVNILSIPNQTGRPLIDDLDPKIRQCYEAIKRIPECGCVVYRADNYCRITKDAVITIPWSLGVRLLKLKLKKSLDRNAVHATNERYIFSVNQIERMFEKLCSGDTKSNKNIGTILNMTVEDLGNNIDELKKRGVVSGATKLEHLINHIKSNGSKKNIMIRFDELVREIRLSIAILGSKKDSVNYTTAEIMKEAIRIFEMMPNSCFHPINIDETAREYEPRVYDTSGVDITFISDLTDVIAEHVHDHWSLSKMEDGWSYNPVRDNTKKHHPALVPYKDLSENEKSYDKNMANQSIKLIITLGYTIIKTNQIYQKRISYPQYNPRLGRGYEINVADTQSIILDDGILELSDIIAENAHNEWAQKRIQEGLRYGPKSSTDPTTSPYLIPYFMMDKDDRAQDQRTALETLRIITYYGYRIAKPETLSFWERMRRRYLSCMRDYD